MKKICVALLLWPFWLKAQEFDSTRMLTYLKHLSSPQMEGRKTDTPGAKRAAQYIASELKKMDIEPMGASYFQPFEFKDSKTKTHYRAENVIGFVKGTRHPDRYLLLSAHYDHLGTSGDTTYYGADDNASGVALLLELANYLSKHKPHHSVIFAAFDGEELGLQGSEHFVKHPPIALKSIIVNLNFDMVARADKGTIWMAGTKQYPTLKPLTDYLAQYNQPFLAFKVGYDGTNPNQKNWTESSDHYNFHKKKVPFLYFGVEDHRDYHKSTDKFEKINPAIYFQICKRICQAIVWYDDFLK